MKIQYMEKNQLIKKLEDWLQECSEQFKLLPNFEITEYKSSADMVKEYSDGIVVIHPLDKDNSGNWIVRLHTHIIKREEIPDFKINPDFSFN